VIGLKGTLTRRSPRREVGMDVAASEPVRSPFARSTASTEVSKA
jgi:hypothetical protein